MDYSVLKDIYPNLTEKDFEPVAEPQPISFNDAVLEQKIREALNLPSGDITMADTRSLTALSIGNQWQESIPDEIAVKNIDALKYFPNLEKLEMQNNGIYSITTLRIMKNLTILDLSNNPVRDIHALASFSNLKQLNLSGSLVNAEELASLAGLTNLDWAADLNPQVNELLYDGRNLIVNTVLFASPTRFLGTYGGEGERFDLWTNSVRVLVNGEPYTDFTSQGGGLSLQSYLKAGDNGEYDMDAVRAATSVTEQTTLIGNQSPAFPSGPVTVVIEMWLMDGSLDDLATVGLVAIITQTFTFDTTDGNAKLDAGYSVTQALAGTAPLTINNKDGSIENRMFDFSSVTVGFTVERRATGINVILHYSFPNDEDQSLWNAIVPGATGGQGVQYEAFVNGISIGKVYHTANHLGLRDDPVIEIPLTESELAAVQSITLRPWVRYLSSYSIDGETFTDMPLDTKLTMSQFSDHYTEVALENCDIVIPLK